MSGRMFYPLVRRIKRFVMEHRVSFAMTIGSICVPLGVSALALVATLDNMPSHLTIVGYILFVIGIVAWVATPWLISKDNETKFLLKLKSDKDASNRHDEMMQLLNDIKKNTSKEK